MFDIEKFRSIGALRHGRTRDEVRESRREDGVRIKATTDQLGNITTEHAAGDRVDVHIHAPTITVSTTTHEARG
jgi:hypothetical protein